MKAVSYYEYGSPDVLKLEDIEKPVPKDDEILIRIYATTVTAVDSIFRNGKTFSARLATGVFKPKINIPGSDFAGEVEAVGKNVSLFKIGDKVFGDSSIKSSTYAEYICLPVKSVKSVVSGNSVTILTSLPVDPIKLANIPLISLILHH